MFWEMFLSATIETGLGLLAEIGLDDTIQGLREVLHKTDEKKRAVALQTAFDRAMRAAADPALRPLLRHRPFQDEVVRALLDPLEGFNVQAVAAYWGEQFPEHALALRRFFNALQNELLKDEIWGPVLERYQALRFREEALAAIEQCRLPSNAVLVRAVSQSLEPFRATLTGEGAIAQGPGAKAVGAGGILAEGDYQHIVQVTINQFLGEHDSSESDVRQRYLSLTARQANVLPWSVVTTDYADPARGENLNLADVYIDLDTTELRHMEREEELRQFLRQQRQAERLPAQEMVNREAKLLIMGDPGSGKSTFVKHLTYLLAKAALGDDSAPWLDHLGEWQHGALLPVRVELRQMAAYASDRKQQRGNARLLRAYLCRELDDQGTSAFWDELDRRMSANETEILFLLDGLDEVPTGQRQMVVDAVNDLCALYPEQRYVVTCRPYAYVGQPWRLDGFHEVTLAPFSEEQIERFIENWYRQLEQRERISPGEAESKAGSLKHAVMRRDLRGLAERPLLLTVMAQLHAYRGKLPEDRTQLYADAVDLLLERWETRLDTVGVLEYLDIPGLKMSDLKSGLYRVAFEAHRAADLGDESSTADIPEEQLRKWLAPYLNKDWNKAGAFIEYIRERAGLLIRHKTEAYTFPHRSFQEYLAACHWLSLPDYPGEASRMVGAGWDRWREVFVLSAGYAARTERLGQALAAVNTLLPRDFRAGQGFGEDQARTALLAAQALVEIGLVGVRRESAGQAVLERVQGWLVAVLQSRRLPAYLRAEAGRAMGKIGDPRPGVMDVDEMRLCYIPAGPFWMGSKKGDSNERPRHKFVFPAFWISRYPVTNAQFQAFVDAGGYALADLWPEARKAGVWQDGLVKGSLDNELRSIPFDFGEPFNLPNHPVVGVTWYEALAFVRWLTLCWQERGWLPEGWKAVLPSEAEWEKAARGGLKLPAKALMSPASELAGMLDVLAWKSNPDPKRIYPWGAAFDPEKANTEESGIGATSAVGCFQRGGSPYGVLDLSGNVWEWTRSLWGEDWGNPEFKYPYDLTDGRENLDAPDNVLRVLRGGSFDADHGVARCAFRYGDDPDDWFRSDGFRVVVSPVL